MQLATLRDDMVSGLEHPAKGVLGSEAVGVAMRDVPRHDFIDVPTPEAAYQDRSYDHRGTTVLAPSTAARLLTALDPAHGDDVLVVGAGVGYTVAVCAEIAGPERVTAVDLSRPLVYDARSNLSRTGYGAVLVDRRDGAAGVPEYAPYDRILLEAAAVRPPQALLDQLAPGGRLVMPLGTGDQDLVAVESTAAPETERRPEPTVAERFGPVRFRPLLVEGEEAGSVERNRTHRENREMAERAAESSRGWEQEWIDWDSYS